MKPNFFVSFRTSDPCVIGEYLRDTFFDQSKGTGCYSTFDINPAHLITELPKQPVEGTTEDSVFGDPEWNRYRYDGFKGTLTKVEMRYYWDGDGVLEFIHPDGWSVVNRDCKCDYTWEFVGVE